MEDGLPQVRISVETNVGNGKDGGKLDEGNWELNSNQFSIRKIEKELKMSYNLKYVFIYFSKRRD